MSQDAPIHDETDNPYGGPGDGPGARTFGNWVHMDVTGREIEMGDRIGWAVMNGSKAYLRNGEVIEIRPELAPFGGYLVRVKEVETGARYWVKPWKTIVISRRDG